MVVSNSAVKSRGLFLGSKVVVVVVVVVGCSGTLAVALLISSLCSADFVWNQLWLVTIFEIAGSKYFLTVVAVCGAKNTPLDPPTTVVLVDAVPNKSISPKLYPFHKTCGHSI